LKNAIVWSSVKDAIAPASKKSSTVYDLCFMYFMFRGRSM